MTLQQAGNELIEASIAYIDSPMRFYTDRLDDLRVKVAAFKAALAQDEKTDSNVSQGSNGDGVS